MAKEIPASASAIAEVAEAAGQLGIEVPNIMDFTKVMIDLGNATNMSADEAATALARFANITQMSQRDFDKLGSVIVDLGNNLATTEGEIVAMSLRLAGAGSQIGLTEAQIMSFAGALSSVGIEAQAGGSAFSKVMIEMQLAVETGSEGLKDFANVAGMTTDEFSKAFRDDAGSAIISFIEGLGNAEEQGLSTIKVLDDMGITEVRLRDALLRASGASDVFKESIEMGTQAWEENIALTNEAEQRYKTSESQMVVLKNTLNDLAITFGEIILPVIMGFVEGLKSVFEWLSNLSPEIKQTIVIVAGLAAAVGPLLIVIGKMSLGVSGLIKLFAPMIAGLGGATGAAGGLSAVIGALTGPIGIAIAAIVAITAVVVTLWQTNEDFRDGMVMVWDSIKQIIDGTINIIKGIIQTFIGLVTGDWTKFTEGLKTIWSGMWEVIINVVGGAWNLLSTVFNTLKSNISNFFTSMVTDAFGWGKNLISGFIDGIKSMVSAVSGAVSNVVGGVKDFLGFSSPAKKGEGRFIEDWGSNMIGGFITGMNKAMPELQKSTKAIMPVVKNEIINTTKIDYEKIPQGDTIIYVNNPQPSPSELARQIKKQQQELALGF